MLLLQTVVSIPNNAQNTDLTKRYSETPESVFGTYLSLYECHRICAFCTRNSPFLKPAELTHLITLCSQRRSTLLASTLFSVPSLKTIAGYYSPNPSSHIQRTTLMLARSIPLDPSKPLNGAEARILSAGSVPDEAKINHHPFVRAEDESDISHSVRYVSAETVRLATLRYTSCISLPYLTSSKKLEKGVMCAECNLRMRYQEYKWKHDQRNQRIIGGHAVASTRRRDKINEARKAAAKFYVLNPETQDEKELSIQDHYRIEHTEPDREMSQQEVEWREKHKGPALPALSHKYFWRPPKSEAKVKPVASPQNVDH
jgi:hypothetical protein